MIRNIIFDFDSTIINAEGIELVIQNALQKIEKKERNDKLEQLREITNTVTNGEMPLSEAFHKRFALAEITLADVQSAAKEILETINPTVKETISALQSRGKSIFVFSTSFEQIVKPVAKELGISEENTFANRIRAQGNQVLGVNEKRPLFMSMGKVYIAEWLKNEGRLEGDTAVVGDGFSDLAIRKNNIAQTFVYFSGSNSRPNIQKQADFVVDRFDQLLPLFCSTEELSNESAEALAIASPLEKEKTPQIILLENIHKSAENRFVQSACNTEHHKVSWSEKELCAQAENANILGIRSKTKLTARVISCLPNLWAIGAFCIGTNQIDLTAATNAGLPVFNAPYSNTRSVAELVAGEVIMLMRRVIEKSSAAHLGKWLKGASGCTEIRGKIAGIIGYGHIGSQVSILLENLGMSVIFHDIVDKLPLGNVRRAKDLHDVLARSDVVTLHVPDTPETRGMIGRKEIAMMKDGAFLINASRGRVVDLEALREALVKKHIAGAAVDVFPQEPAEPEAPFYSPLQNMPNVILTPHIGGSTQEAQENIARYVSAKLLRFINTGATIGAVNLPEIDLPRVPGTHRILHFHKNVPGVLAKINSVFARRDINVEGQILQTRGPVGYLVVDVDSQLSAHVFDIMKHIAETIKVRRII